MTPVAPPPRGGAGHPPAPAPPAAVAAHGGTAWARGRYRGSGWPGAPVDRRPGVADRLPADPRPESPRLRWTGAAWLAAWEVARRVPEPVAFGLADVAARVGHARLAATRERVRTTLARVAPGTDLSLPAFRSYARYWVEAFRAADLDPDDVDRRTTTDGFAHLDAALDRGRGVVVLLAHHGSWDVAARWAETHGYHLAVVAEVLRPRRLFARFAALREGIGLEIVPFLRTRTATGRRAGASTAALARVLAANHLVGLLADRDLGGDGEVVELFGAPARIPRGPAVLAQRTGAALVPITLLQRPGRRWHLQVLPVVDVAGVDPATATRRVAAALEDLVRLDPAQWHAAFSDLAP